MVFYLLDTGFFMFILIIGLIIFLGAHSVRIFFEQWRLRCIEKWGPGLWKGAYSLLSIIGFSMIVLGFEQARSPVFVVWEPPLWTWHITVALNLLSSIFLTAAYVPHNAIKAKLKDPMVLGVKTWALAHLLSNGTLAGIIVFASFLVWAVLDFRACRKRRALLGAVSLNEVSIPKTALTLVIGSVAWLLIAGYAHSILVGVSPMALF
jgi:hypothetical protein